MRTRTEGICECCEKSLVGMAHEETETKEGHAFCSYACMEDFYGVVPEGEDFVCVPR